MHTCTIAAVWRTSNASILEFFRSAEPALANRLMFIEGVADWLRTHVNVIEQWAYSDDKRTNPSPYFQLYGPRDGHQRVRGGILRRG